MAGVKSRPLQRAVDEAWRYLAEPRPDAPAI
jgi:hypothetical protein